MTGYRIVYEKMNTSRLISDWYNYADLLVYYGLNSLLYGCLDKAEKVFLNLTRMWDGYGFRDNFVKERGVYQVYKCALYIYLYRALEAAGSSIVHHYRDIHDKCLEIICRAQDPVKGGIYTDYMTRNGTIVILKDHGHDMNTETTSIVILALYSKYPELIGKNARSNILSPVNVLYLVSLLSILASLFIITYSFIMWRKTKVGRATSTKHK